MRELLGMSGAILSLALLMGGPARANTYTFTFTGSEYDVDATITGTQDGSFVDITSITGTIDGPGNSDTTIASLITQAGTPPGQSYYTQPSSGNMWLYDDVWNPSGSPFLDNAGLLFTDDLGNIFNLYSTTATQYYLSLNSPQTLFDPGDPGTLTDAPVTPIPGTAWLFIGGLACLALLRGLGTQKRKAAADGSISPLAI